MDSCQEEHKKHVTQEHRQAEGCYQTSMVFNNASTVPGLDRLHATLH